MDGNKADARSAHQIHLLFPHQGNGLRHTWDQPTHLPSSGVHLDPGHHEKALPVLELSTWQEEDSCGPHSCYGGSTGAHMHSLTRVEEGSAPGKAPVLVPGVRRATRDGGEAAKCPWNPVDIPEGRLELKQGFKNLKYLFYLFYWTDTQLQNCFLALNMLITICPRLRVAGKLQKFLETLQRNS